MAMIQTMPGLAPSRNREGELDQLLRKLVGAVFFRAEAEIPFFAYAEIAVGILAAGNPAIACMSNLTYTDFYEQA